MKRFVCTMLWGGLLGSLLLSGISPLAAPAYAPQKYVPVKTVPSVISRTQDRHRNRIYAFDQSPLDQRTPVILVPGRAEEYQFGVWWKQFHRKTRHNKAFNRHYKLYLFLYDSNDEVDTLNQRFVEEARAFLDVLPDKRAVVWVTYSLGGIIVKEGLRDPEINDRARACFAIAVPFHGSPLFTPHWFIPHLHPPNYSPLRRAWDRTLYRTYFLNKKNLTRAMYWDSFDTSGPVFGRKIVRAVRMNAREKIREKDLKAKLIVYASYLENPDTQPKNSRNPLPDLLKAPITLPGQVVAFVLPSYLLSTHGVFAYMNQVISRIPIESSDTLPFRYNDGAIPLSSQLYLPRRSQPYRGDLAEMTAHIDVGLARIFPNLDHMDTGEYQRPRRKLLTPDFRHPQAGTRTPIEWVLYDLDALTAKPL